MQDAELERFKGVLKNLLEVLKQPAHARDAIAVHNDPDNLDRVQRAAECELAIRRFESDFSRKQAVELALERIEDGSYGTCLRCENDISSKRLQAVPWASYCLRCQDLADRERQTSTHELDLAVGSPQKA